MIAGKVQFYDECGLIAKVGFVLHRSIDLFVASEGRLRVELFLLSK